VNVTQFHNPSSGDGFYIDSAFTQSAAANLTRDLTFDGAIVGNVHAQPLYIDKGPGGRPMIVAVTESNNVYALDALDGSIIWERNMGEPVSMDDLICSDFDPMGIIGTPIVDIASRALFFNTMVTCGNAVSPGGRAGQKHCRLSA
jgi:outer membrane protein assembly factor BamB